MAQRHQHLKTSPASTYEQLGFEQQCDCPQLATLMSSIIFNYTGHNRNWQICWDVSSSWSCKAKDLRKQAFLWPIRPFQHIRPLLQRCVYEILRIIGSVQAYWGQTLHRWRPVQMNVQNLHNLHSEWNSQSSKANSTTNMIHLIP